MKFELFIVLYVAYVCYVEGFKFPTLPMCKKSCKKNSDCKPNQRCIKISICKNKICFVKLPTVTKPPTTTTATTTTTTPEPTTPEPTLPPNTCPPPAQGELVNYRCPRRHKKDAPCFMSCKNGYCPNGGTITICRCKSGKCSWTRNLSKACKPKNKDQCRTSQDCDAGHICRSLSCGKVCFKKPQPPPCIDRCVSSESCPRGMLCADTKCGKRCQLPDPGTCLNPCPPSGCPAGQTCVLSPCGRECRFSPTPPGTNICLRPCLANRRCPDGYTCENRICGMECILKRAPSCAVPDPTAIIGHKETCPKVPKTCTDGNTCKSNEVCCYSTFCRTNLCKPKVNICPENTEGKCFSDAECSPDEICIIHKGGCKTCSKDPGTCLNPCPPSGCPVGQTCVLSPCGRECRFSPVPPGTDKCLRPCIGNRLCPDGYTCEKRVCGMECILKRAPSCAVPDPTAMTGHKETCLKIPKTCTDDNACKSNEVCCYSTFCRTNLCKPKVNICPENTEGKCFSDADCSPDEICIIHKGGCKKCSKGMHCTSPKAFQSCDEDSDCKMPVLKCIPREDGCRTCSIPTAPAPQKPKCDGRFCLSDKFCRDGEKCVEQSKGCKVCQALE